MPTPVTYRDYPVRVREVEVLRRTHLTPTMIRITLGGPGAAGFESGIADEHVKLIFPDPDTGELRVPVQDPDDPDELVWPRPMPTSREYTVRAHRRDVHEIDIDFVVHGEGLASTWAETVEPGGRVHVAGPPGGFVPADDYGFWVVAGDETALPAIARIVAELPRAARGHVVVEVHDESSRQELDAPEGVLVTWVHAHGRASDAWGLAVMGTDVPLGADVYVWLAGEAGAIKPVRRWVRGELGVGKEHSSITGYWKRGLADTHEHLDEDDEDDVDDLVEELAAAH